MVNVVKMTGLVVVVNVVKIMGLVVLVCVLKMKVIAFVNVV